MPYLDATIAGLPIPDWRLLIPLQGELQYSNAFNITLTFKDNLDVLLLHIGKEQSPASNSKMSRFDGGGLLRSHKYLADLEHDLT